MPHNRVSVDIIYSTVFFWWASKPEVRSLLEKDVGIPSEVLDSLQRITQATDRSFPADEFPEARRNRRTIIMHVGPTNSGKTHHALRALAAASTGLYAGPLRLLAHEVWERLNTGQILPLGVELDERNKALSLPGFGDPRYMRLCNLITGEEQRFMGEHVPLHSCTIEMLSFRRFYDVAVVDEIQMLADKERANAWVGAVLGINAKELHLCGEETAIPIVQELLKYTGDEIIVRRYDRLSPLIVEEESLAGDLSKVQKGDCIVTFNRKAIFALKQAVERKTRMRCAVVYGRLPPEIRSEQAALFNDPKSGYDVLIGSDAIGMGLNLCVAYFNLLVPFLRTELFFFFSEKSNASSLTQCPNGMVPHCNICLSPL
jgi:ATP-dependent RNA helicase SUPV3L1/SUV3